MEYIDAADTISPPQSIRRNLNAAWAPNFPDSPTFSKFFANPYVDYNHPIWAGSDLLGLFLSSFGPAPAAATYSNFYVPLLCVFGRWCQVLSQVTPEPPTVQIPFMYQVTWLSPTANNASPAADVFFLGASLGGYDLGDQVQGTETGAWLDELRATRYNLVPGARIRAANFVSDDISSFPGAPVGNRFGNCAEVYPMLRILGYVFPPAYDSARRTHVVSSNGFDATLYEANGAAMTRKVFENAEAQYNTRNWVPQLDKEAYRHVVKPCPTCDVILRQFNVTAADLSDRFCKRLNTNIRF